MDKIGEKAGKLAIKAASVAAALTAAFVTAGVVVGAKALSMGADTEEMMQKYGVVFKDMTETVDKWAVDYAEKVGRSSYETKEYLANIGDLTQGLGMTKEASFDLASNIVSLGTDLASFNNVNDATAIEAVTKAMLGEADSAKQLGLLLNVDNVKEYAESQGLVYESLTDSEKAMQVYNLAIKQSKNAIGDAERSSASYTNQLKALSSSVGDIMRDFGLKLIPIATKVVEFIRGNLIPVFKNLVDNVSVDFVKIKDVFLRFGINFLEVIKNVLKAAQIWVKENSTFLNKISANFSVIFDAIKKIVGVGLDFIKDLWETNGTRIKNIITKYGLLMQLYYITVTTFLKQTWTKYGDDILAIFSGALKSVGIAVTTAFKVIEGLFDVAIALFKGDWETAWNETIDIFLDIWDGVKEGFSNTWEVIKPYFLALVTNVKEFFTTFKDDMIILGEYVIDGLIEGIKSKIDGVTSAVKNTAIKIATTFTDFFIIKSPSKLFKMFGEFLMEGLGIGVKEGAEKTDEIIEDGLTNTIDKIGILQDGMTAAMGSKAAEAGKETGDKLATAAESSLTKASSVIVKKLKDIGGKISENTDWSSFLSQAGDMIGGDIGEGINLGVTGASGIGKLLSGDLTGIFEIGEAVQGFYTMFVAENENTALEISENWGDALNSVQDYAKEVTAGLGKVFSAVYENLYVETETFVDKVTNTIEKIGEFVFGDNTEKTRWDYLEEDIAKLNIFLGDTIEFISNSSSKVSEQILNIANATVYTLDEMSNSLLERVGKDGEEISTQIVIAAAKAIETLSELAEYAEKEVVTKFDEMGAAIISALTNKYESEKALAEESLNDSIEKTEEKIANEEDSYNAWIERLGEYYDKQVELAKESYDNEIAALKENTEMKKDEYDKDLLNRIATLDSAAAAEIAQYNKKIATIQAEAEKEVAAKKALDIEIKKEKLKTAIEIAESEKDLADAKLAYQNYLADLAADARDQQRKDEIAALKTNITNVKETLQEQIEAEKVATEELKSQAEIATEEKIALVSSEYAAIGAIKENSYEEDLKRIEKLKENSMNELNLKLENLNSELLATTDMYEKLLEADNLKNEALKLAAINSQDEVIELLTSYGDSWFAAGQSFGDQLVNGIEDKKSAIKSAIEDVFTDLNNLEKTIKKIDELKNYSPELTEPTMENYQGEKGASTVDDKARRGLTNPGISGNVVQNITVNSPKELNAQETARLVKNSSRELALGVV